MSKIKLLIASKGFVNQRNYDFWIAAALKNPVMSESLKVALSTIAHNTDDMLNFIIQTSKIILKPNYL